ncbi:energy-coupling factor ABC transporter permease [Roseateles sp. BYS180W]|uniref:Energy-coupling factor ABC transporter permease n=1 Tax=Roseateles rivi TaxID=3299028 RepID=A0ABW7FSJ5_9BURK
MHIEPGLIAQPKLVFAAVAAVGVLLAHLPQWLRQFGTAAPRTLLAAVFFSVFMQAFHMPAGPSELHFLGAMPIYIAFGYLPTLLGLPLGLLLQGLLFDPQDLPHLAVNALSLMLPLMAVHFTLGQRLLAAGTPVRVATLVKLDGVFYSGVVAMVAFWLSLSSGAGALAGFETFALHYAPLVLLEPAVTLAVLWLLRPQSWLMRQRFAAWCFESRTAQA